MASESIAPTRNDGYREYEACVECARLGRSCPHPFRVKEQRDDSS